MYPSGGGALCNFFSILNRPLLHKYEHLLMAKPPRAQRPQPVFSNIKDQFVIANIDTMKFLLSCSVFAWLTSALSLVVPGSHPWSSLGFPTHQADQDKRSGGGCGGANSSGYNIDLFSQKVGPRPAEEIFWYTYITVGTPPQQL
jgi:hypothetical protein